MVMFNMYIVVFFLKKKNLKTRWLHRNLTVYISWVVNTVTVPTQMSALVPKLSEPAGHSYLL